MSGILATKPIKGNFIVEFRLGARRLHLQEAKVGLSTCPGQVEIHAHRLRSDDVVLHQETAVAGGDEARVRQQFTGDLRRMAETCGLPFNPEHVRIEQRTIQPIPAPDFTKSVKQEDLVAWKCQQRDHPTTGKPTWVGEYHIKVRDGGQVLRDLYQKHGADLRYIELVERDGGEVKSYKDENEDPGNGLDAFLRHAQTATVQQNIEKQQDAAAAAHEVEALDQVRRMAEQANRTPGTVEDAPEYITVDGVRIPKQSHA